MGLFSKIGGLAKKALPIASKFIPGGALLDIGLGAYSLYQGNKAGKKQDQYRKLAEQQAQQQWQAGAPLREAGMRDLMNEEAPDLSGLYAGSQNAFRRMPRRPGGM